MFWQKSVSSKLFWKSYTEQVQHSLERCYSHNSQKQISCPVNSCYIPCFQVPLNLETFTALFLSSTSFFPEAKLLLSLKQISKSLLSMFGKLTKWKCLIVFKSEKLNKHAGWALQKKSCSSCSLTKLQNHSVLWMVNCGWPAFLPVRLLVVSWLPWAGSITLILTRHLLSYWIWKTLVFVLYVSKQVIFICWSSIFRCELRSALWFQKCWSPGSF